jgi:hypothetical protein
LLKILDSWLVTGQFLHRLRENLHQMQSGRDLSPSHRPEIFSILVAKVMSPLNISRIFLSPEIELVVFQAVEDRRFFPISITPKVGNLEVQLLLKISAHSVEGITDSRLTMAGEFKALAMAPVPGHLRSEKSSLRLHAP